MNISQGEIIPSQQFQEIEKALKDQIKMDKKQKNQNKDEYGKVDIRKFIGLLQSLYQTSNQNFHAAQNNAMRSTFLEQKLAEISSQLMESQNKCNELTYKLNFVSQSNQSEILELQGQCQGLNGLFLGLQKENKNFYDILKEKDAIITQNKQLIENLNKNLDNEQRKSQKLIEKYRTDLESSCQMIVYKEQIIKERDEEILKLKQNLLESQRQKDHQLQIHKLQQQFKDGINLNE